MKRKPNKPQQEPRERPAPGRNPPIRRRCFRGRWGLPWRCRDRGHFWTKCPQVKVPAEKQTGNRPPLLSSAWRSAGKSWRRPKTSWQNRSPRKARPHPAGGPRRWRGRPRLCAWQDLRERAGKRGHRGAHRSELVGEAALRHGSRFVKRKVREHPAKAVQRAESKYVKATADYYFRMAAQEHPEMSGNPVSRMWRKHRLKKQYQKRAREAVKTGAAGAAKRQPPPRKRPGQRR